MVICPRCHQPLIPALGECVRCPNDHLWITVGDQLLPWTEELMLDTNGMNPIIRSIWSDL